MPESFFNTIQFIKDYFGEEVVPLHTPVFIGNEKKYLNECIDTTYVSSVGKFVDRFEEMMCRLTGAAYAVATVNGTSALHIALHALGADRDSEVITQPLTFVATCNAIAYTGADPVFVDVDKDTMGMSPRSLEDFLNTHCETKGGRCINKTTGKTIAACVPMHTFGFPCRISEIVEICDRWHIDVIEDAAESLGSYVGDQHTGTIGKLGIFSFNGNKVVTAGGGGCVVTNDERRASSMKHLTTTAKEPHRWEYRHDKVGYNYRMPNINAALACAQLEHLELFLKKKRDLAGAYRTFFDKKSIIFKWEREGTKANYWLNTIELRNRDERDEFLEITNNNGVMTRPAWELMTNLPMYKNAQKSRLDNAGYLADRIVNIPSSVIF